VRGRTPPWATLAQLLASLAVCGVAARKRTRGRLGGLPGVYVSTSALCLVLASCGKDESTPHDISMPIDDFPASAELYLNDLQGTAVARVDAAGSVVADAATHAYGAVRYESGGVDPYGFVGNERDFGAGISDFQARPYRPELSRFLGVDPVPLLEPEAFSEGFRWQAYTYAAGDPVNGVDRDGRWVFSVAIGARAAALMGLGANAGVYVSVGGGARTTWGVFGSGEYSAGAQLGIGVEAGVSLMPVGNYHDLRGKRTSIAISRGPFGVDVPLDGIRPVGRGTVLSVTASTARVGSRDAIVQSETLVGDAREWMDEESERMTRDADDRRAGRTGRLNARGQREAGSPNASIGPAAASPAREDVAPSVDGPVTSCQPPEDC